MSFINKRISTHFLCIRNFRTNYKCWKN